MLPTGLQHDLTLRLSQQLGRRVTIRGFNPTSGGCINNGGRVDADGDQFFVKWNHSDRYPRMFEAEAEGLRLLRSNGKLHIPEIHFTGESEDLQYIVMSFINTMPRRESYWRILAEGLVELHRVSDFSFGLASNNYIGSLTQINTRESSWVSFFIEHRLEAQLCLAQKNGECDDRDRRNFEKLYALLPTVLPEERPSLLHGDLWSGNIMTNENGIPSLIDPAVYFGHREVDLSMTRLFGGFPQEFYDAYQANWPLLQGFEERLEVYSLYPLLVHVNLFGGGYVHQVRSVLKHFV
jgi:protein-ribulosamine 3-kinase